MTETTDINKEITLKWLKDHNIVILQNSTNIEEEISVALIEIVGNIDDFKKRPRNRFQACSNFTLVLEELKRSNNLDIKEYNPYKMCCGDYNQILKLIFFIDRTHFDKGWKSNKFNDWRKQKMEMYNITVMKNESLNKSLNDTKKMELEMEKKQKESNAICTCGQILLDKSSISGEYWKCSRCNSRNKIPEGYKIALSEDVSLGGEVGNDEGNK